MISYANVEILDGTVVINGVVTEVVEDRPFFLGGAYINDMISGGDVSIRDGETIVPFKLPQGAVPGDSYDFDYVRYTNSIEIIAGPLVNTNFTLVLSDAEVRNTARTLSQEVK